MTKKIISTALCVVLVFCCGFSASAKAKTGHEYLQTENESMQSEDIITITTDNNIILTFTVWDNGTAALTNVNDDHSCYGAELVLPSMIDRGTDIYALTEISWDDQVCTNITKITLPNANLDYSNVNFYKFSNLSELIVPKEERVFNGSLSGMPFIKRIVFCEGVHRISMPYAFSNCTALEDIVLPEGLSYIAEGAFAGCISLKKINLPSSMTKLSPYLFNGCISLTQASGLDHVKNAGEGCFDRTGIEFTEAKETKEETKSAESEWESEDVKEEHDVLNNTEEIIYNDVYFEVSSGATVYVDDTNVTNNKAQAKNGTIIFSVVPDKGFEIASILVDYEKNARQYENTETTEDYIIENIKTDETIVSIQAICSDDIDAIQNIVTFESEDGISVYVNEEDVTNGTALSTNGTIIFSIIPDDDHEIVSVLVDDEKEARKNDDTEEDNDYIIEHIQTDETVVTVSTVLKGNMGFSDDFDIAQK